MFIPGGSGVVARRQDIVQVVHRSPGSAAGPLIRVRTHPGFQLWAPRILIGVHTHPGTLGLCVQAAADQGARPPRVSGVGAQAADLSTRQPGFRCMLGLLIRRSQSRG